MNRYSMIVQWSEEDELFLVTIPEFVDRVVMPCTHGTTREQAIRNGEGVIEMYLEAWQADGETLPESDSPPIIGFMKDSVQVTGDIISPVFSTKFS